MSTFHSSRLAALTLGLALAACSGGAPAGVKGNVETSSEVHVPARGFYSAAPGTPAPRITPMRLPTDTPPPTATPMPSPTPSPVPSAAPSVSPSVGPTATPTPLVTPVPPQSVRTLVGIPLAPPSADPAASGPPTLQSSFADGPGSTARLHEPSGVAVAPDRTVVVADALNHRIRKLVLDTAGKATLTTLAGTGVAGMNDNIGRLAQFSAPRGVAVDALDPLHPIYVADTGNHRIRKVVVDASGDVVVSTIAGTGAEGLKDGLSGVAQFSKPFGIAIDPLARPPVLYVADTGNHAIRKLVLGANETTVSTVAGTGSAAYKEGLGVAAGFSAPRGVAVDGSGNVYVADTDNHCLRVIAASGQTRTLAGNGTLGFGQGAGAAALLNAPWGVAIDAFDPANPVVYVVDGHNQRVCRVTSDGVVTTLAGSGTSGDVDGIGAIATFFTPAGLAIDSNDKLHPRLFVGDLGNAQVRIIE
jgi:sugar lactone lactonase YvrE